MQTKEQENIANKTKIFCNMLSTLGISKLRFLYQISGVYKGDPYSKVQQV